MMRMVTTGGAGKLMNMDERCEDRSCQLVAVVMTYDWIFQARMCLAGRGRV